MPNAKYDVKPSWILTGFYLCAFAIALFFLWFFPLFWGFKLLVFILCTGGMFNFLSKHAFLLRPQSIITFWQDKNRQWILQDRKGNLLTADLQGDSICTIYFLLLHFKESSRRKRYSVIILPDALEPDRFRQLRVNVKMGS